MDDRARSQGAPGTRRTAADRTGRIRAAANDRNNGRTRRSQQWRKRLVAVKLRLVRMGKKKQPTYRLVAADSRSPRDGRFLEIVGTYAPRGASTAEPEAVVNIDNDKAVKWLVNGAKPTERVERLLKTSGAWDQFTAARAK
jgi:small subunit ribosomal protein S16